MANLQRVEKQICIIQAVLICQKLEVVKPINKQKKNNLTIINITIIALFKTK